MQSPTPILRIHPPQDIRTDPMGITDSDDQPFQTPVSPPERIIIREQSPAPPLPPAGDRGPSRRAGTRDHVPVKGIQGTQGTRPSLTVQT